MNEKIPTTIGQVDTVEPTYLLRAEGAQLSDTMQIFGDITNERIATLVSNAVKQGQLSIPDLNIQLKTTGPRVYQLIDAKTGTVVRRIAV